jgi:hypothetical protein
MKIRISQPLASMSCFVRVAGKISVEWQKAQACIFKPRVFCRPALIFMALVLSAIIVRADDPRTNSWLTTYSGQYARAYTNDVMKTNGTTLTSWTHNSLTQSLPAYCGVQEIYSSSNWVYIRTTGLGSHTMGPWYNDATRTTLFVNFPVNQKLLIRFPRNPTVTTNKTTVNGEGGYFVDGVCMFDARDAVSYINSTGQDGVPPGSGGSQGDGIWNRDAYVNETTTFDTALAHQQNTGVYHYHANPIATRYLLDDHIDLDPTTKLYSESTNTPTKHSPIVGWAKDGFPLYGPYGYSSASNSASGVRRMIPGYVLRNGQYGTANLASTGRTNLPAWAARGANRSTTLLSTEYGPNVSASFPLGRYTEDSDFLGDLGYTQGTDYDLDEYNGRFCVTPEFPSGTYAYFVCITSNGLPSYPYNVGRQFYGSPTAGTVTSIGETVITNFLGGTNLISKLNSPSVGNNTVTLTWSAVEGGKYQVESTTNLSDWAILATNLSPTQITGAYTNATSADKNFYRVARTGAATFDSSGTTTFATGAFAPGGSGSRGSTVLLTITLPSTPPNPPIDKVPTSVAISGVITNTANISRVSTNSVQALIAIPANAPLGMTNVVVTFSPAPTYTLTNGFTIN